MGVIALCDWLAIYVINIGLLPNFYFMNEFLYYNNIYRENYNNFLIENFEIKEINEWNDEIRITNNYNNCIPIFIMRLS